MYLSMRIDQTTAVLYSILFTLAGGKSLLDIKVSTLYGELGGLAILRCTISPRSASILQISWRNNDDSSCLYRYFTKKETQNGPCGALAGRHVTGFYNKTSLHHELKLHNSVKSDEHKYICEGKDDQGNTANGVGHLLLVVSPKEGPSITDQNGLPLSDSSCANKEVPLVKIYGRNSFWCQVGATLPQSIISWTNINSRHVHKPRSSTTNKYGVTLYSIKRQIDVFANDYNVIKCSVRVPDPRSGGMRVKTVCLRLQEAAVNTKLKCYPVIGSLWRYSSMNCYVTPNNTAVQHVEWRSGKHDEIVYYDSAEWQSKDGPQGRFARRKVAGFFGMNNASHELSIYRSMPQDEERYTSIFIIKDAPSRKDTVNLVLQVAPAVSPAILDENGTSLSTSGCDNVNLIPSFVVNGHVSFICRVAASRPQPKVDWFFHGNVLIHLEEIKTHTNEGVLLWSVDRKIDIKGKASDILRCIVQVPNPTEGKLVQKNICLGLTNGHKEYSTPWLTIGMTVGTFIQLPVIITLVVIICWQNIKNRRRKKPQVNEQNADTVDTKKHKDALRISQISNVEKSATTNSEVNTRQLDYLEPAQHNRRPIAKGLSDTLIRTKSVSSRPASFPLRASIVMYEAGGLHFQKNESSSASSETSLNSDASSLTFLR